MMPADRPGPPVGRSGLRDRLAGEWWHRSWNARRRWHRYEVRGIEHFDAVGPALLVGYHGRPVAHDLCMLQEWLRERDGTITHAIMHAGMAEVPVMRRVIPAAGFLLGDGPGVAEAFARGRKVFVTPGAVREGARRWDVRYKVDWGGRFGWLRLAIQHRVPVIPAAGWGVDDTYYGLNDAVANPRPVKAFGGLPVWVGVGPLGVWPFSPPWPVKITTVLAPPFTRHLEATPDPGDKAALRALASEVEAVVQGLLDAR